MSPKGPLHFFLFAKEWMFKKSQRAPFTFFGTMRLTGDFKKIRKKPQLWRRFGPFPPCFSHVLLYFQNLLAHYLEKLTSSCVANRRRGFIERLKLWNQSPSAFEPWRPNPRCTDLGRSWLVSVSFVKNVVFEVVPAGQVAEFVFSTLWLVVGNIQKLLVSRKKTFET